MNSATMHHNGWFINHHEPIKHHLTIDRPSFTHQSTIIYPPINHDLTTIIKPSINHRYVSNHLNPHYSSCKPALFGIFRPRLSRPSDMCPGLGSDAGGWSARRSTRRGGCVEVASESCRAGQCLDAWTWQRRLGDNKMVVINGW